jgi:hypothetical protein
MLLEWFDATGRIDAFSDDAGPKPGSFPSQTENSFERGFSPSTMRFVILDSGMNIVLPPTRGSTGDTPKRNLGKPPGNKVPPQKPILEGF